MENKDTEESQGETLDVITTFDCLQVIIYLFLCNFKP